MQTSRYQTSSYVPPMRRPSGAAQVQPQFWTDELHRWEFMLLQGAVFFAPYNSFRYPSIYITLSDMMFAGAFFLRVSTGRVSAPFANLTWLWLLGLLMLSGGLFIGSVFKGDVVRCLVLTAQYCFAYLLVPLVLLRRPEEEVIRLIKCGIWGMAVMCLLGAIVYWAGHYSTERVQMALVTGNKRLQGFAGNPNGMAVLTVMAMPLVWLLLLSNQMRRWVALLCMALLITGVILTSSNTGLYSMVAAALIFFGGRRNFKTLIIIGLLGSAALTLGQNYLPATFQTRVLSAVNSGDLSSAGTFEGRQELNKEALEMADENLLIGLGADQYRHASRHGLPVHNLYLLLLNEGGGLSLLGYLVLLAVPVLAGIAGYRTRYGKLVLLTIFTTVVTFANALMAMPHTYGRCWFLFVFLAVSPALVGQGVINPRLFPSTTQRRGTRSTLPPLES
ncbi:putative membrane protein [Sphingobium herbicidovorans NBRC 16415]|uniref:Membrane protein n=2 Tax=Sphingobium herbicidovorans TaxID=76947 RepID=A0A086PAN2_SPHHM|nr:putative membrane protein [Sphingobium herbicidovorans NBRC 16415]